MKQNSNNRISRSLLQPNGSVLIVTIWIVLVLAGMILVLARRIRVDALSTANSIAAMQAESVVNGAIEYILSEVSDSASESTVNYDTNPFEAMQIGDGFFWVIRPNLSDDRNIDYGLKDEAGKINLNSASLEMLLKLPGMTSEWANAIIDWRDTDSEVTPGGAESEYYLLLEEPYNCKNSPLETIEEILLVKGARQDYLYGEDINRNGILETNEDDAQQSEPSDNSNGRLDPGFLNYVTVYSYETNQGMNQKVNVNSLQNQQQIFQIISQVIGESNAVQIMPDIRANAPHQNIIDFYFNTGMEYEDFIKIEDKFTTSNNDERQGLVNINSAPAEVLLCLPGLEQSDVDQIVTKRASLEDDSGSLLWITNIISKEKAIAIGSFITNTSYQYGADIVAVSGDGRVFRRYYIIIDTAQGNAKVKYRQSLTHLGWPLEQEALETLRQQG